MNLSHVLLGSFCIFWFVSSLVCGEPISREWRSADGRSLKADYLGTKSEQVYLKLPNGTIVPYPVAKLSSDDIAFIRSNPLIYRTVWAGWPEEISFPSSRITVSEEILSENRFIYRTGHFQFQTDVNLGTPLMQNLAEVFELTFALQQQAPLGILAQPDQTGRFQAELYSTTELYRSKGGPASTAGVYLLEPKRFLAPLDQMNVKKGSAGWRKDSDYDPCTVVHELTHLLTHDLLNNLPLWVNEGYAEYLSRIPITAHSFRLDQKSIREGVYRITVLDHLRMTIPNAEAFNGASKIVRDGMLRNAGPVELYRIAKVITLTDEQWRNERKNNSKSSETREVLDDRKRMAKLYRTAHLIIYYFIQIEGAEGVSKIHRYLDENRQKMAEYLDYREKFSAYEQAVAEFMLQPGVSKLADGRIQYPNHLKFPEAPTAPFSDASVLKTSGFHHLLSGQTPESLGSKIEAALVKDLGLPINFKDDI